MKFRQALFWDVDSKKIDPIKNARYVIERIADFGNDKEAGWLLRYYDKKLLRDVITTSRSIGPRTSALWKLLVK